MADPNRTRPAGGSSPKNVTAETKAKASGLKDEAQEEAKDRLAEGKSKAAGALEDVADALHDTGDALRDRDRDAFARYADTAAEQVEQFTRSIRDRNVGDLLNEAERFARRDAGLFIGGAFLLGIFGARFLKASAPGGNREDYGRTGYVGGGAGGSRRPSGYEGESRYRAHSTPGAEGTIPNSMRPPTPAASPSATTPPSAT